MVRRGDPGPARDASRSRDRRPDAACDIPRGAGRPLAGLRAPAALAGGVPRADRRARRRSIGERDRLALAARSDGIPLYLEELARAHLAVPAGAAEAIPPLASVPAALYEPLVARLYATPAALPVAATVAAAGQEVERSLLAATIALPEEELDSTLRSLLDARILLLGRGPGRAISLPPRAASRGRLRNAAAVLAAQGPQPPLRPPDPGGAGRLAHPRNALRARRPSTSRRPTPTGRRPRRHGGEVRSRRPARISHTRSS